VDDREEQVNMHTTSTDHRVVSAPLPLERTPAADAYPLLLKHLLHEPLSGASSAEIVYRDIQRYDYTRFHARLGQLANALVRLGIQPGDTVGVLDWDSHRYLECFFAIPMLGAVLHTVNVRLSSKQILYTINHAHDDVLLVHADFLPLLESIAPELDSAKRIVLLSDDAAAVDSSLPIDGEYEALLAAESSDFEFPDFDENSRATTFYTTGTTGALPKGVAFSHRQIVLHTLAFMAALGCAPGNGRLSRSDVYMPITPMFHVHAWGMPYVATALGIKQVYPGRYDPDILAQLIKTEHVTFSHGVPTLLHMLLNCEAGRSVDLSNLKLIVGGSALTTGLASAALERGIDVFGGYGMSETCPLLTLAQLTPELLVASTDEQLNARVKAGRPVPLVDLRIVDAEMHDQPHDGMTAGEVVVRAPWLTQAYLKDEQSSEALWRGGYLHTGDVGTLDPRGYLQITDRIKDAIKSGGEWISSLQLESILSQHPSVSEAAVIGVPDPRWGERPLAVIVLKDGSAPGEEEIRDHVRGFAERGVISRWAVPATVQFAATLAKTSVGKIDKKTLRSKYAASAS
jgi:fatty-acyl-CoA synthase